MNALLEVFTREAGQRRREWLNRRDAEIQNALSHYLGPSGVDRRVNALALAAPLVMSGTDYVDAASASDGLVGAVRNRDPWEAVSQSALLAGATMALMTPGVSMRMAQGATDTGVSAAKAVKRYVKDQSGAVGPRGAAKSESAAEQVARLLREGRGAEVTDDLMARADPQEMHRLYTSGATGRAMPMDEASRMARASAAGFDTDAFHATRSRDDFQAFRPGVRGSTYFAATPEGAERGARGQSLEFAGGGGNVQATIPVRIGSNDVAGMSINRGAFDELPDVVSEGDIRGFADKIRATGVEYWDDVYEAVPFGDEFRYYKRDPLNLPAYQDFEPGRNAYGYRVAGWNSGSDEASLAFARSGGKRGFLVSDEAGTSVVAGPDMPVRSRFARFDPRLSHLSNLSAALGILAMGGALDQGQQGLLGAAMTGGGMETQ